VIAAHKGASRSTISIGQLIGYVTTSWSRTVLLGNAYERAPKELDASQVDLRPELLDGDRGAHLRDNKIMMGSHTTRTRS
jgi:hypothetical protein